jgi:squalene-associated FAD-dependent desaturase
MTAPQVAVIGGGLAGITAAIDLAEAGVAVTLLEARPRLGGLASSFTRGDLVIDNGQHVFLRCCTAYRELLARLGVTGSVTIQDRFDVTVLSPEAGAARLRRSTLPSPLHLTGALARYSFLSLAERASVARAALAFLVADPASPALDEQALGDWLATRGQGERARRRLWDLFVVSALNIAGDDASAALAATVIKTGLLSARDAADIGMATVPLGRLHATAAGAVLDRLGVQVRLRTKALSIEALPGGGFRLGLRASEADGDDGGQDEAGGEPASSGQPMTADGIVLAAGLSDAVRVAEAAGLRETARLSGLRHSPIVNVHVVYDRRVTRLPFAAAVDSPVQWVFDKTRHSGLPTGQYLAVSLSAADDYVDVPAARLREQFLPALEQLFPAAGSARVLDFFVTRERRATFRQAPGSGALRPGATTSLPGITLAGAWTDTGWPDTMEGAVRSGHAAAKRLVTELGHQASRPERLATAQAGAA